MGRVARRSSGGSASTWTGSSTGPDRCCMDWSERRYHLAGSLGAALTTAFTERRWIATREASRIVTVTEAGQTGLRDWLGIDLAELRGTA